MIRKPSTKNGFHPRIPETRLLYEQSAQIYALDGELGAAHTHRRLRQMAYTITRLGNLVSSFQIEGIDIDRARAARALAGQKSGSPYEQDMARFGRLYDELHEAAKLPELTPETIREWHARLFTEESLDQGSPGQWKTDVNGVWNNDRADWVFMATPKEDTIAELQALMTWHDHEAYKLPAPIAAAIFFAEFESIHPFPDGNGRLGRLLNLWALKKNGLQNAFLAPIDEQFKRSRDRYYAALSTTNTGTDYSNYCGYYLSELLSAYRRARHFGRLDVVFEDLSRLNARNFLQWVLTSSADRWFKRGDYPNDEELSDATLTNILAELTELDLLEATGERKGRKYRLNWETVLEKAQKASEATQ